MQNQIKCDDAQLKATLQRNRLTTTFPFECRLSAILILIPSKRDRHLRFMKT